MVSGDVIKGRELDIPFRRDVWFCCVTWTGTEFKNFACRDTGGGQVDLLNFLNELEIGIVKGEVLAVWPGQYVTQLFEVRPEVFLPRLIAHMKG